MIQFIPELLLLDFSEPLPKKWKGALSHIGPMQTISPQVKKIWGKTTCGTITYMAGIMLWATKRLESFINTEHLKDLVEASFAWQVDWRYFNPKADPYYGPPDQPIELSALYLIDNFLRDSMDTETKWFSFNQPTMSLSHMITVVRYLLPKKIKNKEYKLWNEGIISRLEEIASAPDLITPNYSDFPSKEAYIEYCSPRRGFPLPPLVLNLEKDLKNHDLGKEMEAFIKSLNYSKNNFLRSPEEMKELGFSGEPYK